MADVVQAQPGAIGTRVRDPERPHGHQTRLGIVQEAIHPAGERGTYGRQPAPRGIGDVRRPAELRDVHAVDVEAAVVEYGKGDHAGASRDGQGRRNRCDTADAGREACDAFERTAVQLRTVDVAESVGVRQEEEATTVR